MRGKQGDWGKERKEVLFPLPSQFAVLSTRPFSPNPPPRLHLHAAIGYNILRASLNSHKRCMKYTRAPHAYRTVLSPAKCSLSQILFSVTNFEMEHRRPKRFQE